jgi:hypothetical protein
LEKQTRFLVGVMTTMAELDELDITLKAPEGEITIKRNVAGSFLVVRPLAQPFYLRAEDPF